MEFRETSREAMIAFSMLACRIFVGYLVGFRLLDFRFCSYFLE